MPSALRSTTRLALLTALAVLATLLTASAAPAASASATLSDGMAKAAATLPDSAPFGAFIHFDGASAAERAALVEDNDLTFVSDFPSADATFASGTLGQLLALRDEPSVTRLEANRAMRYLGDSWGWTTGVRGARTSVGSGPYTVDGKPIDGAGVGVAVVDSGIDGTHPDFAGRIGGNYKVVCSTPGLINTTTQQCFGPVVVQEAPFTDNTGGHGTHVAGIAVGAGTASNGTNTGIAPASTLYSYGVGEGIAVLYNAEAFQHMISNYDTFSPRIRVVNNSYGDAAGTPYDANDVFSKLTKALIDKGVSVVFAGGNGDDNGDGGTGADDRLSSTAKDPTPGVITVANYDDKGTANRDGALDSSSSRGKKGNPLEYPDISAPGSLITSTCNVALPVCRLEVVPTLGWAPYYATISGTSMASPHVAGAAALLYQAKPSLSPAEVEDVLQDTAYKFTTPGAPYEPDPQNPDSTTSFDKGAGLLDLTAALDALDVEAANRPVGATPSITTATPQQGDVNDGTALLEVTGSATDGVPAPQPLTSKLLATGDAGDLPAPVPGAIDLSTVSMRETDSGIDVTIGVRDLAGVPASGMSMRLFMNLGGVARATSFVVTATGQSASAYNATTNNVLPTAITRDNAKSTITLSLPFVAASTRDLGDPAPGSLATAVRVVSYSSLATDQLPGGTALAVTTAPEYAAPFEVLRPGAVTPPGATVTVAVDSGPEQPAVVTGSSPAYDYAASIDTTGLAHGEHLQVSRLYLDGVLAATSSTPFTVTRPSVVTNEIAIASPAEDATVERTVVSVSGTSSSTAADSVARSVTLAVGPLGGAQETIEAAGTVAWNAPVDFSTKPAGRYLLTATLHLDGVAVTTVNREVVVPTAGPPPAAVSCAPEGLEFWKDEYNGSKKTAFTASERSAIASRAAQLSDGYFADARSVTTTLYAGGKISPELAAARQYAPLLLDLAAGQLSSGYSHQVGLAGTEGLKAASYDTATVGTTVSSATTWVRGQLEGPDPAEAEGLAARITAGEGLDC